MSCPPLHLPHQRVSSCHRSCDCPPSAQTLKQFEFLAEMAKIVLKTSLARNIVPKIYKFKLFKIISVGSVMPMQKITENIRKIHL